VRGNYTPVPQVTADVTAGLAPLTVNFSSAGTADADGDPIAYAWDFDADGVVDSTAPNGSYTYTENGVYDATLRVTDSTGRSAAASVVIIVAQPDQLAAGVRVRGALVPNQPRRRGR
jgi:PKD repeat protein